MKPIESFSLQKGQNIANRYTVISQLGSGSEGEVYKVVESYTGTQRAIKLFYPHKNPQLKTSKRYALKLNKLRDSHIVMDYLSHEVIELKGYKVACLISELIEGESLCEFVQKQKNNRLGIFPAIHLIYSIVRGVEAIHLEGEYHGDLHVDNIIIKRFGLEFDLKIIDMHHWGDSKKDNRDEDIIKIMRIFYDILGGRKYYPQLPPSIKFIICGLKRNMILHRFKNISILRAHLELMDWSDAI